MSIGIKATNSKDLIVSNSTFSGLDIDIELDNVEGFVSHNNRHSNQKSILVALAHEISQSTLSKEAKNKLFTEIIYHSFSRNKSEKDEESLRLRILKYVGDKAVDLFVQLVSRGL